MAKNCNKCGKPLVTNENYYCEDCRLIVRQEYLDKEKTPKSEQSENDNPSGLKLSNSWASTPVNSIGTALKTIGFISIGLAVIVGLIVGFVTGTLDDYNSVVYNWGFALVTMFAGSLAGLLIAGIGEIVLLLQGSNDKLIAIIRMTENNKKQ